MHPTEPSSKSAYALNIKPLALYHAGNRVKRWLWIIVRTVLLVGISYVVLYPILLKLSIAVKHPDDIYNPLVVWVPIHFTWDNFAFVYKLMNYGKALAGSLVLSGLMMVLQTVTCALAGYGFARLKIRGSGLLFGLVIFTIVVPPQTIMVPSYLNFKNFLGTGLNLLNTYWPFVISSVLGMGMKAGLYIFIFRQFFRGLPKELEESAFVDGAGVFRTFWRIILPNALPAMVTVMLFAFVWQWNDTYFTGIYLSSPDLLAHKLAALGSQAFNTIGGGTNDVDQNYVSMLVNTGALMTIGPLVILYAFVQRHFVESIERTGIVG